MSGIHLDKNMRRRLVLRLILSILVIGVLVARAIRGDFYTVFLCAMTLVMFEIPAFVNHKLNIKLPGTLEIIILLFIFCAEILGEIGSFYTYIPWWDTMLHTVNGFLMAAIGFALIDILNNSPRFHISLSPFFVAFVAFCFSMTVGVLWEFFEVTMDILTGTDMQKDFIIHSISSVALNPEGVNDPVVIKGITQTVITYVKDGETLQQVIPGGYLDVGILDTMKDLLVNCIGALVYSVVGYFYLVGKNKGVFARKFIPIMKTPEEIKNDAEKAEQLKKAIKDRKGKGE